MSRTFSTITWGLALIVAAAVLAWQQSIPWAIAAAGAFAIIVGIVKAQIDDVEPARRAHDVGPEAPTLH
ncbi:MAG: hypothetical protein M0Z51_16680 [Propionibacterium sp.]|nr:hypothetical protein [Propionibacterium sp.]